MKSGGKTKKLGFIIMLALCLVVFFEETSETSMSEVELTKEEQLQLIRDDIFKGFASGAYLPRYKDGYSKLADILMLAEYINKVTMRKSSPLRCYIVAKRIVERATVKSPRFSSHFDYVSFLSLMVGLIKKESTFNPWARSHKNAVGLMQVHIPTWGRYISAQEATNIQRNLEFGTKILYHYYLKSGKDIERTLGYYYGARDNRYITSVLRNAVRFKEAYNRNIGTFTSIAENFYLQHSGKNRDEVRQN
ncbi:MAG: Membrane-bound lytic murein transglycosylase C [Syntrophomonadaceae bacterium]|nr:Membrane-bound lytic murein transglycosylase C [Bacillota bacterium]